MGSLFRMSTGCDCGTKAIYAPPAPGIPAPTPDNFVIGRCVVVGDLWVSVIRYPGCTNYEGRKVLVTTFDPRQRTSIDPHFLEGNGIIARFLPTNAGFLDAIDYAITRTIHEPAETEPDDRPAYCRERLREEGKAYPKSGCQVSKCGGAFGGCIYA